MAGAALFIFRGCWHNKMSWPVRSQGYSYQVCTNCGIKLEGADVFSVQYHPEASPGPMDSHYLFDRFAAAAKKRA